MSVFSIVEPSQIVMLNYCKKYRAHGLMEKRGFQIIEMKLLVAGAKKEGIKLRQTIAHISAMLMHFQHDFYNLSQNLEVKFKKNI